MMRKSQYLLAIILVAFGCKKPYAPQVIATNYSYLVVEGTINSGSDSTIILLSRTTKLDQKVQTNSVHKATVTVENDQNFSIALNEDQTGRYVNPNLNLGNTGKYRLRIKTPDNHEYLSDFVNAKQTPPIDSIGYTMKSNGIDIYVNSHDASNNTKYYKWDFGETWKFNARLPSSYMTNGTEIVGRPVDKQIFTCFAGDKSITVLLGSSAKLSNDVIYQLPITNIASTSEKLMLRYSMLLKQYALTKEAFEFWQNLKKNTEQLGSIFDAQPSQLKGNIHNIADPDEPVIGYISVCNVQARRVFIDNSTLPRNWERIYPYDCDLKPEVALFCRGLQCYNEVEGYLIPLNSGYVPISAHIPPGGFSVDGYYYYNRECGDCTIRGTTKQPDFWK
jgi:hypothetical protein